MFFTLHDIHICDGIFYCSRYPEDSSQVVFFTLRAAKLPVDQCYCWIVSQYDYRYCKLQQLGTRYHYRDCRHSLSVNSLKGNNQGRIEESKETNE